MIKITINELINAVPILRELTTKNFKGVASFKIARLIREMDKESETFEKTRIALIEKYGARDNNGNLITEDKGAIHIIPEMINECNAEIAALLNTEIEIAGEPLPVEYFEDIEMNAEQAMAIDKFVVM